MPRGDRLEEASCGYYNLLASPLGDIWLQRISRGGRTLWNFLTALAAGTFGLTVYLLAFTFWIR